MWQHLPNSPNRQIKTLAKVYRYMVAYYISPNSNVQYCVQSDCFICFPPPSLYYSLCLHLFYSLFLSTSLSLFLSLCLFPLSSPLLSSFPPLPSSPFLLLSLSPSYLLFSHLSSLLFSFSPLPSSPLLSPLLPLHNSY